MLAAVGAAIAKLFVLGLIALLGWLAGHGGGQERVADGVRVLGYKPFIRGLGVLTGGLFPLFILVLGVWVAPPKKPDDWWAWGGLLVGFGTLGGYTALEGFRTRVVLTPKGIAKFHWWYRPRFVAWEEIELIDPRLESRGDYAVRTSTGTPLGVPGPQFFGPGEWFREACREHLRPEQYPAAFNTPTS